MSAFKFAIEIVRISIMFFIFYWLSGMLIFRFLIDKWPEKMTMPVHFVLAFLIVFIWYRKRGRFSGWM